MRLPAALAIPALLFAIASPAPAATLKSAAARDRSCMDLRSGAGTARERYRPAADGLLTVSLRARRGDWDLGVFDAASRRMHGASASFGARERVIATVRAGEAVIAQACRRSGRARRARLSFSLHEMELDRGEPAQLLRVPLLGARALERLEATGADVTHNVTPLFADVVVYSAAERRRLAALGFVGQVRPLVEAVEEVAPGARRAGLPSGNTAYRQYPAYSEDLKELVKAHPGHVKPLVIGESLEGRPLEGVEIAADVGRADDGRPALLVLGAHHAREWPSAEMPMEFAIDLAKGYGSDPRITDLLQRVRVLVLPVMNPDGFVVSRGAGETPFDDDRNATLPLSVSDALAYKRKNCRPAVSGDPTPCAARPVFQGVDLNRNYGAYWGGVGSSDNPAVQNYRGTAPYSEPEAEAVHVLSQKRNVVTVISHHTFTDDGVWLRQPGFCKTRGDCDPDIDVVPDEPGMKALGDAMAAASGWESQLAWAIGEITGATEDWNYFAAGAYGYTPEQRGPNFHPDFATAVVAEYDGTAPGASGGVRESLLRAAEQAANPVWHSVLEGSAPAGRVLRLRKTFETPTSQTGHVVADELDLVTTVPASKSYRWHVNPSTRPLATQPETYTLTCETPEGTVLETRQVLVARGETLDVDLACAAPTGGGAQVGGGGSGSPASPGSGAAETPAVTLRIHRSKLTRRWLRGRRPRRSSRSVADRSIPRASRTARPPRP